MSARGWTRRRVLWVKCLLISKTLERAGEFDLIHSNHDYPPLTYLPFIRTPM